MQLTSFEIKKYKNKILKITLIDNNITFNIAIVIKFTDLIKHEKYILLLFDS